jgi:hypothetical protein
MQVVIRLPFFLIPCFISFLFLYYVLPLFFISYTMIDLFSFIHIYSWFVYVLFFSFCSFLHLRFGILFFTPFTNVWTFSQYKPYLINFVVTCSPFFIDSGFFLDSVLPLFSSIMCFTFI